MTGIPNDLRASLLDAAVELMGRAGRGGTVRVQGQSMVPTLVAGQRLAVEFAVTHLRRGEVLLFRQADCLVVHRLVGSAGVRAGTPCLRTRGDGVGHLDPAVPRAAVVARVVAVECADGWRSFRGARARAYAWCLAWHDRAWALAGAAAGVGDGALARLGLLPRLRGFAARVDRMLIGLVHAALFRLVHPPIAPPPEARP